MLHRAIVAWPRRLGQRAADPVRGVFGVLLACLALAGGPLQAQEPGAAALHARHAELQPRLRDNAFGRPLVLASREGKDSVEGEIHAELPHAFAEVAAVLRTGEQLCAVMLLHLNVHDCDADPAAGGALLQVAVGPKNARAIGTLHRMTYRLTVEVASPAYLRVRLDADEGPMGTRDYRMRFEAVPAGGATFVHIHYAYGYGRMAQAAMRLYLSTAGRSKIGFTVVGQDRDGRPQHVRGERGVIERNVVRYYLALLAHLGAGRGTPDEQALARLRRWHALTEQHAAQLHEIDLDEYLALKRRTLGLATAQRP